MSPRRWPQLPPARPSLRPSVRSTSSPPPPQPGRPGPAQRRPEQPRPREETGAAPARPCPCPPPRLSVRPSTHPLALPSSCPAASPPSGLSPRCARFFSPRLAVSLSLPSRCFTAPPSLPDLGSPSTRSSQPSEPPFLSARILQESPPERPHIFGGFQDTLYTPGTPLRASHISFGGLPFHLHPQSLGSCFLLDLISSGFFLFWCPPPYPGTSQDPLGSPSLGPPKAPQLPDFSAPPCLPLVCPSSLSPCSLSGLWVGVPCFALPSCLSHICLGGLTTHRLLR